MLTEWYIPFKKKKKWRYFIPNSHTQKKPKICVVSACDSWAGGDNILSVIIKMQKHIMIGNFLRGLIPE